ncbi:DUF3592 domain-containing protein [Streptomyces sp. NPDC001595]|uniref:DUF3592 domain-containing protein n=1 Tax=Streptomyces sp. NPDC001532 TaxID=3154520 RepID=UPI003328E984
MDAVILVLILFIFAGPVLFAVGLMMYLGPKAALRDMRELEATGVEVPATLVSLAPQKTFLRVVYEYTAADGSRTTHTTYAGRNPLHVVGETYPLVRTARTSKNVWMGTMAAVRKERAGLEHHIRFTVWVMLAGVTTCAVAVTGTVLFP